MCQAASLPALFFSLKAKIAWPFLMASRWSDGEDVRALLIASKAVEEGKASREGELACQCHMDMNERIEGPLEGSLCAYRP